MITPLKDYFSKDDNSLVRQARKGDIGAFEELVALHRDKLFTRAFSIIRNVEEAIDITQKAWAGKSACHGGLTVLLAVSLQPERRCLGRSKFRRTIIAAEKRHHHWSSSAYAFDRHVAQPVH